MTAEDSAEGLVHRYASALAAVDVAGLRSLWTDDAPGPFYVLDELHDPILTWEDMEDQFARLRSRVLTAETRVASVSVRTLDAGTAIAYAVMAWRIVGVEAPEPRAGFSRLVATCRRGASGWRLAALVEAPHHVADA